MKWLLDSVILIDHFNEVPAATRFIERHADGVAISAITLAEVLAGFDDATAPLAVSLLDRLRWNRYQPGADERNEMTVM